MTAHPLDRPVWQALTTRQAELAEGGGQAWRFAPDFGMFGAAADRSADAAAALRALIAPGQQLGMVEAEAMPLPAPCRVQRSAILWQMTAACLSDEPPMPAIVPLGDADATEMLALATLTRPGPFFARTHQLGDFIGVRHAGRLVAMAGERMRVPGFTEVSAVCTHPDFRGKGLARALLHAVAQRIVARGEVPFLHSYADNAGAIALYESLGFRLRREVLFTILARED